MTSPDEATECPFCSLPEERVVLDLGAVRIIFDGYPVSAGHALIIPRRHVATWQELNEAERAAITRAISAVQDLIREQQAPDAFNIGINDGAAAGQTVPHLHVHVIPRYDGDVADPRGGVRWVIADKADYWSGR